ncbi:ABC transporter substrate-binding protein [Mangrovicoccus ximenensis]|uniref:ABC transporter substrate-binding protein n=1 Tax=Mangrovicoccus ximenensis TaxID=1911570 RepID=UPI000D3A7313|nr:extracellular solute-binding protein [Mangrovicoccus ximenensis]
MKPLAKSILAASTALGLAGAAQAQDAEIWTYWASGAEADALTALMGVTAEQYPDTPLATRVITGNTAEMRRALQTAFLGGQPPAVYQSGMAQELKSFVDAGRIAPIDAYVEGVEGAAELPDGVRRVVSVDGQLYGVPLNMHVVSNVFYNRAIFDELGLEAPANAEEFQAVAAAIEEAGYQAMGNAGGPGWTMYTTYSFLYGGLGEDGYYALGSGEMAFTDPAVKAALTEWSETYAEHFMDDWTGYTWSDTGGVFANGDVAMYQVGDWLSAYLADAGWDYGDQYGFFPAPGMDGSVVMQMDVMAMTSGIEEAAAEAGADFLRASLSPEGQAAFNNVKVSVAPNPLAATDGYSAYGKAAAEEIGSAAAVIPNLKNLLPVRLGDEFGTLIAAYAEAPDADDLDGILETLEDMRQEMLETGEFVRW